jgi:hypothetical protein
MGTSVIKIKKDSKQINLDIKEINKITENKLFERRVGFLIEFKYIKKTLYCLFVMNEYFILIYSIV